MLQIIKSSGFDTSSVYDTVTSKENHIKYRTAALVRRKSLDITEINMPITIAQSAHGCDLCRGLLLQLL